MIYKKITTLHDMVWVHGRGSQLQPILLPRKPPQSTSVSGRWDYPAQQLSGTSMADQLALPYSCYLWHQNLHQKYFEN